MTARVRRAGRAILPDGAELIWSVADGRRGRRWRAVVNRDATTASLLLELDGDGRPVRLELATGDGLLTLHPEPTGVLHGNAVTPAGVRHLAFPWGDDHGLEIDGLPIPTAATAHRLAVTTPVGEGSTVPVVAIGTGLVVQPGERQYRRLDERRWRIGDGGVERVVLVDADGLPAWTGRGSAAATWPLELDPAGDA